MPKVYSIDSAINKSRPYVELRGELYEVRDLTMKERVKNIIEYRKRLEDAIDDAKEEGEELGFETIREVVPDAVKTALVGVPDEVAESITEREWKALQKTISRIQDETFPVDSEDVNEEDLVGKVAKKMAKKPKTQET